MGVLEWTVVFKREVGIGATIIEKLVFELKA